MKKKFIGFALLAVLAAAVGTGCGSMHHPGPPPKPPGAPTSN